MTANEWISFFSLLFAVMTGLVGGVAWLTMRINSICLRFDAALVAQGEKWEAALDKLAEKQHLDIESLRKESELQIGKVSAVEEKARHALANATANSVSEVRQEQARLRENNATKQEMIALESRLTASISKLETRIDTILDKLSALPKMQAMLEGLEGRPR